MTCEESKTLISGHLDGVLTPEEEQTMRAHLESCSSCRAYLQEQTLLNAALLDLNEAPPSRVADGVMTELYRKKRRFFFAGPGTLIGAAAAVLLLLVAYGKIPFLSTSGTQEQSDAVQQEQVDSAELPVGTAFQAPQTQALEPTTREGNEPNEADLAPESDAEPSANAASEPVGDDASPEEPVAENFSAQEPAVYAEIYNYSDSLPIPELEEISYTEENGNYVYELTAAEAMAIVEQYQGTHTISVEAKSTYADADPAVIVVMP